MRVLLLQSTPDSHVLRDKTPTDSVSNDANGGSQQGHHTSRMNALAARVQLIRLPHRDSVLTGRLP